MRKVKQKSIILTLFSLFLMLILMPGKVEAALTSVNISALPTLNNMSDSRGYFLASGATYTYTVDISFVNPGATVQADFDYISVNIPTATGNILATWDTDGGGTGATPAGAAAVSGALATGSWSNGTARLTITFYWPAESSINASRTITATVSDGTVTMTDTSNLSYGIASSVRVLSFTNNGIASDNRIIPDDRSGAFTVTGRLIYDLPGYAAETVADVVADADITSSTLQLRNRDDDVLAWAGGTDTDNDMSFSVAAAQAFTARAQGYYWQVEVDFAGASSGANETSPSDNRVTLEVNYVVVSAVTFTGGGGRDAPAFYREYENAGTFVQVTAAMAVDSGSGTAMQGDHDLVVNYYGLLGDITVTISSGSTTGTAAVEYNNAGGFLTGWLTTGYTLPFVYRVYSITTASDYYDTAVILGDGTTWNTDTGTTTGTIYWDRDDPPYYDASVPTAIPAINITNTTTAATSITLYWTEITLGSPNVADYNYDFYEYKVYFRENGATIWRIWDGDDDATLRYPAHTGNIDATYRKYTTIPNLKIFTEYEYYVTAVDVFGNEVTEANAGPAVGSRIIRTQPFSITATISDGVTTYSDFSDLTPSQRPVRLNNIKVTLTIVSSSDLPDTVTVWYTTGNISTAPDMVASNTINSGAFATDTLFSSVAERTGPNEWVAYLQTTSAIMQNSNSIRFIVQNTKDSISAYSDSIVEASPATDPNDDEWTFEITSAPIFTPWPVRILNNVIKDSTPAYPSYYLSEDANVTIKIYDIKGRPVVTLLDGAYRRGGQNIKDQGWSGVNKAGRKVGVGLYYIHIKAESTSNGTVILNKFKKVVMAK